MVLRVCKIKDELRGANKAEAVVVVPVGRVVVVTVSNLAVIVVAVPAATAFHAVRPRRRTCSLLLKNAVFFYSLCPTLGHIFTFLEFLSGRMLQPSRFALPLLRLHGLHLLPAISPYRTTARSEQRGTQSSCTGWPGSRCHDKQPHRCCCRCCPSRHHAPCGKTQTTHL